MAIRIIGALLLFVPGGFHFYLVFQGVGPELNLLFTLNAIAALVLGVAMLVLNGMLLRIATVLSLLFLVASFLSLLLALTVGLFGLREVWSFTLVPETFIVEAVGVVVFAVITVMVFRRAPAVTPATA